MATTWPKSYVKINIKNLFLWLVTIYPGSHRIHRALSWSHTLVEWFNQSLLIYFLWGYVKPQKILWKLATTWPMSYVKINTKNLFLWLVTIYPGSHRIHRALSWSHTLVEWFNQSLLIYFLWGYVKPLVYVDNWRQLNTWKN